MTDPAFPADSFLGRLTGDDLRAVLEAGREAAHRPGELILHEGGASTVALCVIDGTIKVTKLARSGREVILELRGPGDIVGDLGALDGEPRSASVIAIDTVRVLVVPATMLDELMRVRAGIGHALVGTLVRRLRDSADRQLELGAGDVLGRVCRRLAELADSRGEQADGGVLIRTSISQQELADWAGISRDGVVRALGELRRLGWVTTGRHRLLISRLDDVRARGFA